MIYGFINDAALLDPNRVVIDVNAQSTNHGFLTNELESYYVNPLIIDDVRLKRLTLLDEPMVSDMSMIIDLDKSQTEVGILTNSSTADMKNIFNVAEFILYRTVIATEASLDSELIADTVTYANYVPGSLRISSHSEPIMVYDNVNALYTILDWAQFVINISGTLIEFKVWINNDSFEKTYPLSTISEVVPPLSPAILLNPDSISTIYQAAIDSANLSASKLSVKIHAAGYTNYISFLTKYITPSTGVIVFIPFNILYKGAVPGTLDMRQVTREYLIDTGLTTEEGWKAILPDLFVEAQFFLLPMWDNVTVRPTRNLYPSVMQYDTIRSNVETVMFDIPEATRVEKLELMDVAYNELLIAIIPDHLNQKDTTVAKEHPTYQRYSPQDVAFQYQEEHTRIFTVYLNRAIAVAAGESVDSTLVWNNFNDREFLSFVVDSIEYHVMSKNSYNEALLVE